MIEVDWKKDYQGEFICPRCNRSQMKHSGFPNGIKQLKCEECRHRTVVVIAQNHRSRYLGLASKLKHETIDWGKNIKENLFVPIVIAQNSGIQKTQNPIRDFIVRLALRHIQYPVK